MLGNLPRYVNCLLHVLVHIFKSHTHKNKLLAVDDLLGGDNPHSHGARGLRTELPKPAGFKMGSSSSAGGTKYSSRLLGNVHGAAHASLLLLYLLLVSNINTFFKWKNSFSV